MLINKGYYTFSILFLSGLGMLLLTASSARFDNEILTTDQGSWQEITTVEEFWDTYPEKMRQIFASLDLEYHGLEPVLSALNAGDTITAGKELITYYKNTDTADWLRLESDEDIEEEVINHANLILNDKVTRGEVTADIPIKDDGGWDWTYTGPEKDDEFGYTLNRHEYFLSLLKVWQETGNEKYADKFDLIIRDWIIHNPLPDETHPMWDVHGTTTDELDWRDIDEVIWRDLDAGVRLGESWVHSFFGFQQADAFTEAGRLLMIYSFPVQANYLQEYHKDNHNWTTMEMNGLGLVGLTFPEIEKAEEWVNYAMEVMENEINGQVYPDGVQTELSTKTQWVALSRFELLVQNYQKAGRSVSDAYMERIEAMYNYLAYSMRPDGHQPLNNDSDREDVRPRLLKAAENFDRPDWIYIATNGDQGEKPTGLASKVFPWAGIHVMRDGWDAMSLWGFYHTGPYGTGHQHRDKLHLSIHAYGRDLLVDGGRFTHENYFSFDPTMWRGYFRSSFSHNVILVDGAGQKAGPNLTETPLDEDSYENNAEFDYAVDTFSSGYEGVDGEVNHTRAVFFVKGKYWVVVDRIETDRPRRLDVLWHYAPDAQVLVDAAQVVSNDEGQGNLRIVPAGGQVWEIGLVKGQTEPHIQGWYSETYGKREPNPTAVYTTQIEEDAVFVWVLVPADGPVPPVQAEIVDRQAVKVSVQIDGEDSLMIMVPLYEGMPGMEG
ncbi:MAG: alginate lyase family protein [Balneolales bacterium]